MRLDVHRALGGVRHEVGAGRAGERPSDQHHGLGGRRRQNLRDGWWSCQDISSKQYQSQKAACRRKTKSRLLLLSMRSAMSAAASRSVGIVRIVRAEVPVQELACCRRYLC